MVVMVRVGPGFLFWMMMFVFGSMTVGFVVMLMLGLMAVRAVMMLVLGGVLIGSMVVLMLRHMLIRTVMMLVLRLVGRARSACAEESGGRDEQRYKKDGGQRSVHYEFPF